MISYFTVFDTTHSADTVKWSEERRLLELGGEGGGKENHGSIFRETAKLRREDMPGWYEQVKASQLKYQGRKITKGIRFYGWGSGFFL